MNKIVACNVLSDLPLISEVMGDTISSDDVIMNKCMLKLTISHLTKKYCK
jgi:hypothetical protein